MFKTLLDRIAGIFSAQHQKATPRKVSVSQSSLFTERQSASKAEIKRLDALTESRDKVLSDVAQYQEALQKVEQTNLSRPDTFAVAAILSHYQVSDHHIEKLLSIINKTNNQV